MSWMGPDAERGREDWRTRSERWSGDAESYRELTDDEESRERRRREDAGCGGRLLTLVVFPVLAWIARRLQGVTHQDGYGWTFVYFLGISAVVFGLVAAVRWWWDRWV